MQGFVYCSEVVEIYDQPCWELPIMLLKRVNRRSQLIEGVRVRILVDREFWNLEAREPHR
jgi:hypothetical protein